MMFQWILMLSLRTRARVEAHAYILILRGKCLVYIFVNKNKFAVYAGQMVTMLCGKAEMELYLSSLGKKRVGRISRNCNQSSWATGCQSGWACSTLDASVTSLEKTVPPRAERCRPCCPGFFCPLGLTCMMRKCIFSNKLPQEFSS